MTMFSWLEFEHKWAEMSANEQKTFIICLGIIMLIMLVIGIFDYIIRKKKSKKN